MNIRGRFRVFRYENRCWRDGVPADHAKQKAHIDAPTVDEVYGLLGAPDDEKRAVVTITIEKLDTRLDGALAEARGATEKMERDRYRELMG